MADNTLYFYRGTEFLANYLVKWLKLVFFAEQKGEIEFRFYDGTKKPSFSNPVTVIRKSSWDTRSLPAILIGEATGEFAYMSVPKDLLDAPQRGSTEDETYYYYYGGEIRLNWSIDIIATTKPERNNLVDLVGIYLSHPAAKEYFQKHSIILPTAPSIGGEYEENVPGIDHPIYGTSMRMATTSVWQTREPEGLGLTDIITRIEAHVDL